jgi:N-acetylglucosamine kinase
VEKAQRRFLHFLWKSGFAFAVVPKPDKTENVGWSSLRNAGSTPALRPQCETNSSKIEAAHFGFKPGLKRRGLNYVMQFFIGVDGGGSATSAAVISDTLEVIGRGQAGASNHYVMGAEVAAQNCRVAAEQALADARRFEPNLSSADIAAWGFGLAGVRREHDAFLMRGHLGQFVGRAPWTLDTDAVAAQIGAFGGGAGIVLSAGTGAICLGVNDDGERFYADGWGPVLGDEGGGYWIGQEALRATCRAGDGRVAKSSLSSAVLTTLNLADCNELVQWTYDPSTSREQIAQLSQLVFDIAAAGGQAAIEIRERAIAHLSLTTAAVARAMLLRVQEKAIGAASPLDIPVALRGGLFRDDFFKASVGYAVGERMVDLKRDFLPIGAWRIVKPQFDAAVGAALMAQKAS